VKQYSYFKWRDEGTRGYRLTSDFCASDATITTENGERPVNDYSAFTVAELGEMLPARIDLGENASYPGRYAILECRKHADWEVVYIIYRDGIGYILNGYESGARFHEANEANARAKMLGYLIENNLITL